MKTANRKDIARKISLKTGYYMSDIEEILNAEAEAILELLEEGNQKVKLHKLMQLEIHITESRKAWDGIRKKYFILEPRKKLKLKPLVDLDKLIERLNKADE